MAVSLRQNARIGDRVQSDRLGRTALNKVVDELRSACTGFGSSAIQAPSTTPTSPLASTGPLNLWFLTAYGSASSGEAAITEVTEHDVVWTSTGTSNTGEALGKLTDYSWKSTGGEPPNSPWTFNAVLSTATATKARVLATNVVPAVIATGFAHDGQFRRSCWACSSSGKTRSQILQRELRSRVWLLVFRSLAVRAD